MPRFTVILGSLDTKGPEVDFLRQQVRAQGGTPLVIDTGVLNEATVPADITRQEVAAAGGDAVAGNIDQQLVGHGNDGGCRRRGSAPGSQGLGDGHRDVSSQFSA